VERMGEKRAAWRKATLSAIDLRGMTAWQLEMGQGC
jgi:hypothetical protein